MTQDLAQYIIICTDTRTTGMAIVCLSEPHVALELYSDRPAQHSSVTEMFTYVSPLLCNYAAVFSHSCPVALVISASEQEQKQVMDPKHDNSNRDVLPLQTPKKGVRG